MKVASLGDVDDLRLAAMLAGDCRGVGRSPPAEPDECDAQRSVERHAGMVGQVRRRAKSHCTTNSRTASMREMAA